tara:strand:- start:869 stop:1351 length:483 start_codon:yes stop_codon:yes gene_type:complete
MGRSNNSFISYVGHAEETEGDKVTLPEKDLWVAVLCRAALDAFKNPPQLKMSLPCNISHKNYYNYDRDQAHHFFLDGGAHFNLICEMAGRNPAYVREKARKLILSARGWNVDIPITSRYRQGPKRMKKHLTGNSYYAAKKKNSYYQAMGKKGGRPKLNIV